MMDWMENLWESPYELNEGEPYGTYGTYGTYGSDLRWVSEWESPYQTVPIKVSKKVPIKVSIKCPHQKYTFQWFIIIIILLELGWASIQQPIIKSIKLIDLNEHLKNLEDSLDRHRAWRHTKVI